MSIRCQVAVATIFYAVAITFIASVPCYICGAVSALSTMLLGYALSALIVAWVVVEESGNQLAASLIQGILSTGLYVYFDFMHPYMFLVTTVHVFLATIFWFWVDSIYDINR